jgi:hypothetical protein
MLHFVVGITLQSCLAYVHMTEPLVANEGHHKQLYCEQNS